VGVNVQRIIARWLALGLATSLIVTCFAVQAPQPAVAAGGQFVPETQHTLSGPIRTAWEAGGGVWVYGYPISEPFVWTSDAGEVVVAQYFERTRLEYHPSLAGTAYSVLGGLLGNDLAAARRAEPDFVGVPDAPTSDCAYIAATQHSLCGVFQRWWNTEGGLPVFGYPISEPFQEGGFEVQYFERARLEYHPEYAGTRWEVELGRLGVSDAARRGLLNTSAFASASAPSVTTRVDVTLYDAPGGGVELARLPAGATVSVLGGPSYDWYYIGAGGGAGWAPFSDLNWSTLPDPRNATLYTLSSLSSDLAAHVATADDAVSVAVFDPLNGRMYAGGQSGPVAAASLSKTLLLTIALRQSENRGESPTDDERAVLASMIEVSDNDAANTVWNMIGLDDGALTFLSNNHLDGFLVPDRYDWGAISAEAPAWATFLGLLGSGQLLTSADTAYALGLMQAVISDHRWGVLTPGPDRLSVGKNGWYLDEDDAFDWRINSAGFVDSSEGPLGVAPLVVVSLARYPGEFGMDWGVDLAHGVADAVVAWAGQRWWEAQIAGLGGQANLADLARNFRRKEAPSVVINMRSDPAPQRSKFRYRYVAID
jgi:hypothetical protein